MRKFKHRCVIISLIGVIVATGYVVHEMTGNVGFAGVAASIVALIIGWAAGSNSYKWDYSNRFSPIENEEDVPVLMTVNGFGSRMVKPLGDLDVRYQFMCILFVPILPVDCFVAEKEGFKEYKISGFAEWNGLEILSIYCLWWGAIAFLFSIQWSFMCYAAISVN